MLRQSLLLVVLCAAATLLHTTEASETTESVEPMLKSFTWEPFTETSSTLRVCFTSSDNITKPFQFTYYYNSTYMTAAYSDTPYQLDSKYCGNVVVDDSAMNYDSGELYAVDSGEVHLLAIFAMKIQPGVLHAESLTGINITRVGGLTDYEIEDCEHTENSHCIIAGSSPPDSLCTQSEDSVSTNNILVCDSTFSVISVDAKTQVTAVELSYDDETIRVAANSASSTLQIMIDDNFGGNYTLCEGSVCPVTRSPGTSVYTLLIIELDDNFDAMSSNAIDVQDLNMLPKWLSYDSLGVSWEGPEATYTVTVGEGAEKETREVNCTDCTELFMHRTSEPQSVTLSDDTSLTKVVASVPLDKPENVPDALASLSHTVNFTDTGFITTKVCVMSDHFTEFLSLVIVDSKNKTYSTSDFYMDSDGYNCAMEKVDTPTGVTTVIVTGYSNEEYCSTQADLYFFMPQLERRTDTNALASWQNLNKALSYSVLSPAVEDGSASVVQCFTGQSCRYYVSANDHDSMSFTLVENADILQTTTTILEQLNIEVLVIDTELRRRSDDHLLVCYDPGEGGTASRYELGLEREGELLVSDENPQTDSSSEELCLITSETILLGAYVRLWAVVAEFDSMGNVKRSGEQIFEDLYLSEDMGVYAHVAQQGISTFNIRSSWKLVDDTVSLTGYTVSLNAEKGKQLVSTVSVPITQSTYAFENVSEDLYIICVVVNGNGFSSEQVCSDVIHASVPSDTESIPEVDQVETFITMDNFVKVSWSLSTDKLDFVTSFLIDFGKNTKDSSKTTELENTPLSRAGAMQRDSHSTALDESGSGFRITPASQTTLELSLDTGSWIICVSAMKGNQAGQPLCEDTVVGDSSVEVPAPENVRYHEKTSILNWDDPSDGSGSSDQSYYIEAKRANALNSTTTSGNYLDLSNFVGSGEWTVSVQTVRNAQLSIAVTLFLTVDGITITVEQTGNREMRVEWSEFGEESTGSVPRTYVVIVGSTAHLIVCVDECVGYYTDTSQAAGEAIYVSVQNDYTGIKEDVWFHFEDIPSVSQLKSSYHNESSATISWDCVDEASSYNVSLYNKSGVLKLHEVPATCSYTFDDPSLGVITEDTAAVQVCTAKSSAKHPTRCGDVLNIALKSLPENEIINITQIEWMDKEYALNVTLTVCADTDLASTDVSLIVGLSGVGTKGYPATSVGGKCANFSDAAAVPPPDVPLTLQLIVIDSATGDYLQRGFVTFSLAITALAVQCESSEFIRFSISTGSFAEESCLPNLQDPLLCYTPAQDRRVCVLDLDKDSPDLKVCVTQTPSDTTGVPEAMAVRSLNYADGSVSVYSNDSAEAVLTNMIFSNRGTGNVTVSSCQNTCTIDRFVPSAEMYDLCGVFTDTTDGGITSAVATFQDLDLAVDLMDPFINFHVVNKYSKGIYKVYTGNNATTVLDSGTSVELDCTLVSPDALCFGFLDAELHPAYLAVAYDDGTNAVISLTSS